MLDNHCCIERGTGRIYQSECHDELLSLGENAVYECYIGDVEPYTRRVFGRVVDWIVDRCSRVNRKDDSISTC